MSRGPSCSLCPTWGLRPSQQEGPSPHFTDEGTPLGDAPGAESQHCGWQSRDPVPGVQAAASILRCATSWGDERNRGHSGCFHLGLAGSFRRSGWGIKTCPDSSLVLLLHLCSPVCLVSVSWGFLGGVKRLQMGSSEIWTLRAGQPFQGGWGMYPLVALWVPHVPRPAPGPALVTHGFNWGICMGSH